MSCNYTQDQLTPSGIIDPPAEWGQCLINMLRAHVGDFTDPPLYSNERLFQILVAAAYLVQSDVRSCEIDMPTVECDGTIIENPFLYPAFINLTVLKALCILDRGLMRGKFNADGIRAACGPASIAITSSSSAYNALFTHGGCAAYESLKRELCFLDPLKSARHAKQIVSLFINDWYDGSRWCNVRCNKRLA